MTKQVHTNRQVFGKAVMLIAKGEYDPNYKTKAQCSRELTELFGSYVAPDAIDDICGSAGIERVSASRRGSSKRDRARELAYAIIATLEANLDNPYIDERLYKIAHGKRDDEEG